MTKKANMPTSAKMRLFARLEKQSATVLVTTTQIPEYSNALKMTS